MTGSVSNGEFKTAKDDEKWYSDGIDTRYNPYATRQSYYNGRQSCKQFINKSTH